MLRSHNTIPSKSGSLRTDVARLEEELVLKWETGSREVRVKIKRGLLLQPTNPGSTTLFLTLKSPISLRRGLLRSPTNFSDLNS